jgi:hypothetical protein
VHGIQTLPVTDVTEYVLDSALASSGQLEVFAASCAATPACTTDGWAAFAALERALVDPAAAWREVCAMDDVVFSSASPAGNGNSRLNALYWVATRPGAADAQVGASGCRGVASTSGLAYQATLLVIDEGATAASRPLLSGARVLARATCLLLALGAAVLAVWRWRRQRSDAAASACSNQGHPAAVDWDSVALDESRDYRRLECS